jgi:hypothetical protein
LLIVIGLAVMLVGLPTAQATDTTLTLACEGTASSEETFFTTTEQLKPEPVSMSIIVITQGTVQGFGFPFYFLMIRSSYST